MTSIKKKYDIFVANLFSENENILFILQIVEICPTSTKELPPGTRLCAYWSQQYRCLYPGTSVEPIVPDPVHDEKYVTVEFDDGDSGSIILEDIRLLQPNYPLVGTYQICVPLSVVWLSVNIRIVFIYLFFLSLQNMIRTLFSHWANDAGKCPLRKISVPRAIKTFRQTR